MILIFSVAERGIGLDAVKGLDDNKANGSDRNRWGDIDGFELYTLRNGTTGSARNLPGWARAGSRVRWFYIHPDIKENKIFTLYANFVCDYF